MRTPKTSTPPADPQETQALNTRAHRHSGTSSVTEFGDRLELQRPCVLRGLAETAMEISRRTRGPGGPYSMFEEGPAGKPALSNELRCAFNLSRSEYPALVAMADIGEIDNFSAAECAELAINKARFVPDPNHRGKHLQLSEPVPEHG